MSGMAAHYLPWQVDVLQRALELHGNGHLPHAVLVDTTSESDIGDFSLHLASLLLCDEPRGVDHCGQCDACRLMLAGTYADFTQVSLEIDEKTKKTSKNIKIEQIRNLIHELSLTPQYARLKIAVIYPAEAMSKASANALLKTLEEPAPGVLIMLVTHNRGRIPVTLRSRCQSWSIHRPTTSQALTWLTGQGLDRQSAEHYLAHAPGDPALALDLHRHAYADMVDQFKPRLARFLRGELSVADLCRSLVTNETSIVRRMVNMTLKAYCLQTSGIDADANPAGEADRPRAQDLFELRQRAQHQLQVEENNLDFQLQLEDVLISLKQILTRRLV